MVCFGISVEFMQLFEEQQYMYTPPQLNYDSTSLHPV